MKQNLAIPKMQLMFTEASLLRNPENAIHVY